MTQNKYPCEKCRSWHTKQLPELYGRAKQKIKTVSFECMKYGFMWSEEVRQKDVAR